MATAIVDVITPSSPSKNAINIKDILTCGYCHKILKDPWALPCFHNFCHGCLPKLHPPPDRTTESAKLAGQAGVGTTTKNGSGIHCAVCETYAKPRECTKNYLISELLTLFKVSFDEE